MNGHKCVCTTIPVYEVMEEKAALMGPIGRPGLYPESGVKNLPWTQPEHTYTYTKVR